MSTVEIKQRKRKTTAFVKVWILGICCFSVFYRQKLKHQCWTFSCPHLFDHVMYFFFCVRLLSWSEYVGWESLKPKNTKSILLPTSKQLQVEPVKSRKTEKRSNADEERERETDAIIYIYKDVVDKKKDTEERNWERRGRGLNGEERGKKRNQ